MKDYTLDEKEKGRFITSYEKMPDGTYTVHFADGSSFKRIIADEDNLARIQEIQRRQADEGIKNYSLFRKRASHNGVITAANVIGVAGLCAAATFAPGVRELVANQSPLIVSCDVGIITLVSSIPSFMRLTRSLDAVSELNKIKYVDKNRSILYRYKDCVNSLVGLSKKTTSFILSEADPFSIENIGNVSLDDLRTIVSNITHEDELGFTYKKVPKKTNK